MLSVACSPHLFQPASIQISGQGKRTTESLVGYQGFHLSVAVSMHPLQSGYCYVRQCSLYAYLLLISLYEMCLGELHYISLYALSLHSTLAHLWVPFSLGVSWNKRTSALQSNNFRLSLHITQTEMYL